METAELEPEREIDARIAEKIMGCKVKRSSIGFDISCGCPDRVHEMLSPGDQFGPHHCGIERYSSDITAFMKVCRKMGELGFEWLVANDELYFEKGDSQKPGFQCGVAHIESFDEIPLKGCRAALKALHED